MDYFHVMVTTRFAPSPTGFLHLGHAFSAFVAAEAAARLGGQFILRIEDIDPTRCKPEWGAGIVEDLTWLGLLSAEPVRVQSHHMKDYTDALLRLDAMGMLYPCTCTRKQVAEESARAGYAPHREDAPLLYAGTCREKPRNYSFAAWLAMGEAVRPAVNWRINMARAVAETGSLTWDECGKGRVVAQPMGFGDVVLARKDMPTSYHISVVVDDALQGITHVTRGMDLYDVTAIHRVLQNLLGLPAPRYLHHPLMCDETGKRFAKRDNAVTLRALRSSGVTPETIRLRCVAQGLMDVVERLGG